MNIVFFTPVGDADRDSPSLRVAEEWRRNGHAVAVAATNRDPIALPDAESAHWREEKRLREKIAAAAVVVYRMGNDPARYAGALGWLAEFPGLVWMEDAAFRDLFREWDKGREKEARAIARFWYGEAGEKFFSGGAEADAKTDADATFCEWIGGMAKGVLLPDAFRKEKDRIAISCPGPVFALNAPPQSGNACPAEIARKLIDMSAAAARGAAAAAARRDFVGWAREWEATSELTLHEKILAPLALFEPLGRGSRQGEKQ